MHTSPSYYDMIDAFAQPGCAICALILRDVTRLLDSILYEYVTDPKMRDAFRASRGLCNEHGGQLIRMHNVLGITSLYEAVLDESLRIIEQTAPTGGNPARGLGRRMFAKADNNAALVQALAPTAACVACTLQSASTTQYASVLSNNISDARMLPALRASSGVCLDHFRQVLSQTSDPAHARQFIDIQREIWNRLRAELREFMRKYDSHNSRGEAMGAEGDSWRRAVAALSGAQGLVNAKHGGKS